MAIILSHSHAKYFQQYISSDIAKVFYDSGSNVEDLMFLPGVKAAIPSATVSIYFIFHFFISSPFRSLKLIGELIV